ncbi:hypothetical protein EYF80_001002 [Liparis tanakae]|uniref:Uncharacterized protein n=1 Tax=Liparis tanakae TaxID=230148 RepID=A0A4Z2JER7_9TELE|nr:hypothetical protein EYF80_001002 [Liparis tanakae]
MEVAEERKAYLLTVDEDHLKIGHFSPLQLCIQCPTSPATINRVTWLLRGCCSTLELGLPPHQALMQHAALVVDTPDFTDHIKLTHCFESALTSGLCNNFAD